MRSLQLHRVDRGRPSSNKRPAAAPAPPPAKKQQTLADSFHNAAAPPAARLGSAPTAAAAAADDDDDDAPSVRALRAVFGHARFRAHQREIVEAALAGRDVFVAMATGGGKSLCYQLPAVLARGVTVVISPLLSLIEDQVSALVRNAPHGVPAAHLTSSTKETTARQVYRELWRRDADPSLKLLYVTPERVNTAPSFGALLDQARPEREKRTACPLSRARARADPDRGVRSRPL